MAAQTDLHASEQLTSARIGYALRRGGVLEFYDNTAVAAATGIDSLITTIQAAVKHSQYDHDKLDIIQALRFGKANGDLTDARVQGAATVADLVNLTAAANDPDTNHLGPAFIA